jgi:ABC-type amino acid transport system permease subunit
MARKPARKIDFNDAAQMSVRMLIASYFMATAVGSIPGADTGALLAPLLNEPLSRVVAGSIVFTLATMVLIGKQTRLAALLLGLLTFWRDMALIAALMLTYGGPAKAPPPAQSTTFTIRRIARRAERARQMGAPHQPIAPILHAEPDASRVPANDPRRAEPATA